MIKTVLRGYQQTAVVRALAHDGFLIFAEQRTGKCLMALKIVDTRKPKHLWIVCPVGAMEVWPKQIRMHLKVDWDCQLVMINYEELIARRHDYYKQMKSLDRDDVMIIADEIHRTKKRGTATSTALRTLARRAKYRLGLTGTPLGQGIQDGWAYFNFTDPRIFGPYSSRFNKKTKKLIVLGFEDRYLIYGGFGNHKVVDYQHLEEFYRIFHAHSYRITLDEARRASGGKAVKKHSRKIIFDLDPSTRELYDELEEKMIIEVNKKKVKVPIVIALLMKLQQLTGGFVITEDKSPEIVGNEKLRRLLALALDLKAGEKKFVIVCRFIYEIERLRARLTGRGISCQVVSGGNKFDGEFREDCVIIQVQSGVAVDMSVSDHTLFYSSDYSYLNHEQVKFRILNYDKPMASFYWLLARDTIDAQIYEAVTRKKNLAHIVLDKYRRIRT